MSASHARRGRVLELAVGRQSRLYQHERRCALLRQRVQQATGRDGRVLHVSEAPVDFLGAQRGARALAVECKQESGAAVKLSRFDDAQRAACGALHELGAEVLVLVGFMSAPLEVYVICWPELAAFMAEPWRASLSRAWCRVHGRVAPAHLAGDELRRVAFLDTYEHPGREQARAELERERVVALRRPPPSPADDEPSAPPSTCVYAGMPTDAIRERLVDAVNAGVNRQLRHQRRRPSARRTP